VGDRSIGTLHKQDLISFDGLRPADRDGTQAYVFMLYNCGPAKKHLDTRKKKKLRTSAVMHVHHYSTHVQI
jgi:hypothetical protein